MDDTKEAPVDLAGHEGVAAGVDELTNTIEPIDSSDHQAPQQVLEKAVNDIGETVLAEQKPAGQAQPAPSEEAGIVATHDTTPKADTSDTQKETAMASQLVTSPSRASETGKGNSEEVSGDTQQAIFESGQQIDGRGDENIDTRNSSNLVRQPSHEKEAEQVAKEPDHKTQAGQNEKGPKEGAKKGGGKGRGKAYKLEITPPLDTGRIPYVDIVAVHDIVEKNENPWVLKVQGRGPPTKHSRETNEPTTGVVEDKRRHSPLRQTSVAEGSRRRSSVLGPTDALLEVPGDTDVTLMSGKNITQVAEGTVDHSAVLMEKRPFMQRMLSYTGITAVDASQGPLVGGNAPSPAERPDPASEQTHEDQLQDDANNDGRPSEKETHSGRSSLEIHNIDWLRDANMLRSEIPNARVLTYSYLRPRSAAPPDYLNELADNLISELTKQRPSGEYDTVPIIFVGHGFGCIVLQRALTLLKGIKHSPELLRLTAGTIFLDGPLQAFAEGTNKKGGALAQGYNGPKRWILDWLDKKPPVIDASDIWNKFHLTIKSEATSVVWFHTPVSIIPRFDVPWDWVLFKRTDKSKELNKFISRKDPDYVKLVGQVKRCLVLKSSTSKLLGEKLRTFVDTCKFPVDSKDDLGQTSLHWAASTQNLTAVEFLTSRDPDAAGMQDKKGQTPLHIAVRQASNIDDSAEGAQATWKHVIRELMKDQIDVNVKDISGKSAWDHAEEKNRQWILRLKDDQGLITGLVKSRAHKELESVDKPEGKRLQACHKSEARLLEFFWNSGAGNTDGKYGEQLNPKQPSVFRLIYDDNGGLENILSSSRPMGEDPMCRWIHIPANNEQWIHDLFVKLRIQDSSMNGQRYEGPRKSDHFMIAQARKYKHEYHKNEKQEIDQHHLNNSEDASKAIHLRDSKSIGTAPPPPVGRDTSASIPAIKVSVKDEESTDPVKPKASEGTQPQEKSQQHTTQEEALVIFMPILGFERHRHRKYLTQAVNGNRGRPIGDVETETELLLEGYLHNSKTQNLKPIHCRRTLDKFAYYMLDSTERRDKDQVVYRWAKKRSRIEEKPRDRPILMVDQLWLWALHDGNVITGFANTWNPDESFSLTTALKDELRNEDRPFIRSAEDLTHMILRISLDFFNREGPMRLKFQECFQSSINDIANEHAKLFKHFKIVTEKLARNELDTEQRTKEIENLFRLDGETHLLVEIMDVQDELTIVRSVLTQQKEVLDKMLRFYPKQDDNEDDLPTNSWDKLLQQLRIHYQGREEPDLQQRRPPKGTLGGKHVHWPDQDDQQPQESPKKSAAGDEHASAINSSSAGKALLRNRKLMIDNIGIVNDNIRVVEGMIKYAENVKAELNHLLDLKQKQANAWEARFAREGSEETRKQGNVMLVFTLVTIVFLPLSFICSFFALDVVNFPRDIASGQTAWPLSEVSGYLFGISAALSIPLIVLAFRVNEIRSWMKRKWRGKFPSKRKRPVIKEEFIDLYVEILDDDERDSDVDSQAEDDEKDNKSKSDSESGSSASWLSVNDPDDYARLFGIFSFHTKIPGLRKLWKYSDYFEEEDDDEVLSVELEKDYPLRHGVSVMTEWIASTWHWLSSSRKRRRRSSMDSDISDSSVYEVDSDGDIIRSSWRRRRRSRSRSTYSSRDSSLSQPRRRRRGVVRSRSPPFDDILSRHRRARREEIVIVEEVPSRHRRSHTSKSIFSRIFRPSHFLPRYRNKSRDEVVVIEEDTSDYYSWDVPEGRVSRLLRHIPFVASIARRSRLSDATSYASSYFSYTTSSSDASSDRRTRETRSSGASSSSEWQRQPALRVPPPTALFDSMMRLLRRTRRTRISDSESGSVEVESHDST